MDKATKWGLIATVLGVVIAILALFRDVFDYKIQPNKANLETPFNNNKEGNKEDVDKNKYEPKDDNTQSCIFNLLKNIEDSCEIELCVKLEEEYSEEYTNLLKQELENKFNKIIPYKIISLSVSKNKNLSVNSQKYYFLIADFKLTFKATKDVVPEIGQNNLITGSSSGRFSLFKSSIKNRISDCPVFINLAGTEKLEITQSLITSIFKNI